MNWGADIWNGFIDGVKSKASAAKDAVLNVGRDMLKSFKDMFQFGSPSKVFKDFGQMTGAGFAEGIDASSNQVQAASQATLSPQAITNNSQSLGTRIGGITLNVNVDGGSMESPETFAQRLSEILPETLATLFEDLALQAGA